MAIIIFFIFEQIINANMKIIEKKGQKNVISFTVPWVFNHLNTYFFFFKC